LPFRQESRKQKGLPGAIGRGWRLRRSEAFEPLRFVRTGTGAPAWCALLVQAAALVSGRDEPDVPDGFLRKPSRVLFPGMKRIPSVGRNYLFMGLVTHFPERNV